MNVLKVIELIKLSQKVNKFQSVIIFFSFLYRYDNINRIHWKEEETSI